MKTNKLVAYLSKDSYNRVLTYYDHAIHNHRGTSKTTFTNTVRKVIQDITTGSIETLFRIVDENGGFTIIPEMHLPFLTDRQRERASY